MKYIAVLFFLFSFQAFSDEEGFDLNFRVNFSNDLKMKNMKTKKYFSPINYKLGTRFEISADITEQAEFNLVLNPTEHPRSNYHCSGFDYVNEASLTYTINEIFSFDLGCVMQKRGGFESIESSDLSYYDIKGLNQIYDYTPSAKYAPAFNLNIDFFGTLTLQILQDKLDEKNNIPALNIAWSISLLGLEPLIQVGFHDKKFSSLHYSAALKAEFDQMTLRGGYFADTNKEEKRKISAWNIYVSYENSSWFRPFMRVHSALTKLDGKIKDETLTFSLGNKMELTDEVEPYLSINVIKDTDHNYLPELRLGVSATI